MALRGFLISLITSLMCIKSIAQTDTASSPITVLLPVKAVVLYGYYLSQNPNWSDRKAPDQIVSLIGSGNQPDSVVTVTMQAGKLATFATQLIGDRYGSLGATAKSILSNSPAITGYTALSTQIGTKASTSGAQKDAATYVKNKYNAYLQTMSDLYDQMYAAGLSWIRN
jgi:hypothetical protein